MTVKRDILVIGGGIAGIGAAARMSPDAKVTVLEAEPAIGHHSTGRSAAIFIRNYGNAALRALNAASVGVFIEPDGIADSSLLSPRGEMLIANENELGAFEAYLEGGEGLERLTAAQATELVPILRQDAIAGAAIEWDAQDIDVDRLLQGFARMLRSQGGQIVTDARVTSITRKDGGWCVTTNKEDYFAPVLVNAAGAWGDHIATMAGVAPVGLRALRRSAALIPAPTGYDINRWPLFASASEQWYAKPEAGKLMISPADEDEVEPHDVWADDMVLAEGLDRFEQAVTMPITRVEHSWAGLRSFVADRTPVVGFAPDADGFFWLVGQGGYGIQTAPALSQLAADLSLGRRSPLPGAVIDALGASRPSLNPQRN
ncbi:NAD(P)/FAD-dependent oxidoreductase [Thalassovita taeanensis]|uniref:Glycine/D-amino acid oxidase n=1 Tax=Thalassovita taeanensis TaxID=657014 RepID=A0A1H9IK46_9RHOB|nr:FAD-binding oxidoreductase [Thalassovita taeanensis]SEQ75101.1 Glycine/D-amino acid oxidase [Thalassovita taeanensis]